MDEIGTGPVATPSSRGRSAGLLGAGLIAGLVLGGVGLASAQSADPTPAPPATSQDEQAAPGKGMGRRHGPGGGKAFGLGPGVLHGEFTTRAPDSGYQRMASQAGEVTAVSATSITVKSEDGYARTYVVNDGTMVNAGNEGTADIEVGDQVRVLATVAGEQATAVQVVDVDKVRESRGRWHPGKAERQPAPAASPTS